jgi:1-deoxy-D-xylulose-5-phosphate synthase
MHNFPLLSKIENPEDLKNIPEENLPQLAKEIRDYIVSVVSENGGHLASNLGVVELTIALHTVFHSPIDKIIWDVGHQSYTHKILTGRRKYFTTLRKLQGMSGFPKHTESIHDPFDTGHSSTSISAGLGILIGQRLQNREGKVIAVIGDGALTGGMAFEALNNAGHLKENLIIVLNDNKMSISKNVGALSSYLTRITATRFYQVFQKSLDMALNKLPVFGKTLFGILSRLKKAVKAFLFGDSIFSDLGFEYIGPIEGHNIQLLLKTFRHVRMIRKPVVVHVRTQKGRGYIYAEGDPSLYHGVSPFSIIDGKIEKKKTLTFTEAFSEIVLKLAMEDPSIVAITAAMTSGTGLSHFQALFPKRFFDVGITEQHAVTFAAGLAASGLHPIVAIYSTFMQRAVDQVIHDAALQKLPVIFAMDRAGLVGDDGETHQGLFDIALFKAIPGIVMLSPSCKSEMELMFRHALVCGCPVMIRYPKAICCPESGELASQIVTGRGVFVGPQSGDALFIITGGLLAEALFAREILAERGIQLDIYNLRFIKPIDEEYLEKIISAYEFVFCIEEGSLLGGIGEQILSRMSGLQSRTRIRTIGASDQFISHGTREELLSFAGLDGASLASAVEEQYNTYSKLRVIK